MRERAAIRKISTLAMMAALAAVLVLVNVPFPLFPDFKYDLADIPIFITTFAYGPGWAILITAIASAIQAFVLGQAGPMGFVMHLAATGGFALAAGLIYQRHKTKKVAVIALIVGCLVMTALMCVLNYVLDPIFWGLPKEAVAAMIVPAIIPFNLSKAGINSVVTFLIYKRISNLIHRAEHRAEQESSGMNGNPGGDK